MQNLELGDFGGMKIARFGDRGLLFVCRRRSATPLSASLLRRRSIASSTALLGLSSFVSISV